MTARVAGWVADILRDAERARDFVGALSAAELARDEVRLYDALHALTLVGEAAKRVPAATHDRFPEVTWKGMAGLRDIIVHQYDEVDVAAIHRTATSDAQVLIERLPAVIAALGAPDGG